MYREFDREMARYGQIPADPSNPVGRLRIVTNTEKAVEFLTSRARQTPSPGLSS
ncbi:MAG: restriction endonuclease fold toxin-2 domain-containing protein [Dermatophilaceae bacterium]